MISLTMFMSQYFNSQPHEEADQRQAMILRKLMHFNSQPHEEADILYGICVFLPAYFNSQPHEEADSKSSFLLSCYRHFNSQPHEEADGDNEFAKKILVISTHSLTKRLTAISHKNF